MGLSGDDFWRIRDIFSEEVQSVFRKDGKVVIQEIIQRDVRDIVHDAVSFEMNSLNGRVTALENDIKEIYFILARIEKRLAAKHM